MKKAFLNPGITAVIFLILFLSGCVTEFSIAEGFQNEQVVDMEGAEGLSNAESVRAYTDSSCRFHKGMALAPYQIFRLPVDDHALSIAYYKEHEAIMFLAISRGTSSSTSFLEFVDTPGVPYEAGYIYKFSFIDSKTLEVSRTNDGKNVEVVKTFTVQVANPNYVEVK